MEVIQLDKDISVIYVIAASFPDGISAAQEKIHSLIPNSGQRRSFGISHPENGIIKYMAGVEEIEPGEAEKYGCERFIIKAGKYQSVTITSFPEHLEKISDTFQELLKVPNLDPQGYCLEWYLNAQDV